MRRIGWQQLLMCSAMFMISANTRAVPEQKESMRLVVSANALEDQDPFLAFYQSRIFRGEEKEIPFIITNADEFAFETDEAVFYPVGTATPEGDTRAALVSTTTSALVGHSYRGLLLKGEHSESIRRYLGADKVAIKMEKRRVGTTEFVAMHKNSGKAINWPKSIDDMRRVRAVIVQDAKGTAEYMMIARTIASRSHRLGVVDSLLKKKTSPSLWVDLGSNAHGRVPQANIDDVYKRSISNVFSGMQELTSVLLDKEQMARLPMTMPFAESVKRTSTVGNETINWWSLANNENVWSLYEKLGKKVTVIDGIERMKVEANTAKRGLNIVRVYSEEAALTAARSVYVDLVLMLASDPYAQLPTRETIELRHAETDAYEQIAPIVRISLLDVNEVLLYEKGAQKIQHVEVVRHTLNDTVERAQDVAMPQLSSSASGLVARAPKAWEKSDLEKVLGGIIRAETKADLAIFAELPRMTAIASALPFDIAKNLMVAHGNVVTVAISGRQVKKISKLIASHKLPRKHVAYGLDVNEATIGDRAFADNERFTVALTEDALLDLFGLSRLGGLSEEYAVRAPFIEGIYADSRQLFYIGGPKVIPISDTANEIERAVRAIKSGRSVDDVVDVALRNMSAEQTLAYIKNSEGKPQHVITLDIAYLDIGISKNVTNENYRNVTDFPTSRGGIPPFAHLFLYTKMALNYQTPTLYSTLFTDIKYMHTNLDEKPEKDKARVGLKFRLPWEQSYFKDKAVVLSPIFNKTYETKLAPHPWSKGPKVTAKPRTRRIDSLLGVNLDFTKLGFNVDIGGAMATDFNRFTVRDAIDFGPGLNFASRWRLFGPVELSSDFTAVYLFPLPQGQAQNKVALGVEGTIWLRLARIYDFSVATQADMLMATLQEKPRDFVFSTIFGFTVSYGRLFRLLG